MKKVIALLLSLVMVASLAACSGSDTGAKKSGLKAGFIFLHDENST